MQAAAATAGRLLLLLLLWSATAAAVFWVVVVPMLAAVDVERARFVVLDEYVKPEPVGMSSSSDDSYT
jgi:hypothetical protein